MKKAESILLAVLLTAALSSAARAEPSELWIEDAPTLGAAAERLSAAELRAEELVLTPADERAAAEPSGELLAKFAPEEMTGVVTAELYFGGRFRLSSLSGKKTLPVRRPVSVLPSVLAEEIAEAAPRALVIIVPEPESENAEEGAAACRPGSARAEFPREAALPALADIYVVSFREERRTYKITAEAGEGGAIVPSAAEAEEGGSAVFQIMAKDEWTISSVSVNGRPAKNPGAWRGRGSFAYKLEDISGDTKISASFEKASAPTYFITVIQGENGTITPSGSVTVTEGEEQDFTVTASPGCEIKELLVNGSPVEEAAGLSYYTYGFPDVYSNGQTIEAAFVRTSKKNADAAGSASDTPGAPGGGEISGCRAGFTALSLLAALPALAAAKVRSARKGGDARRK